MKQKFPGIYMSKGGHDVFVNAHDVIYGFDLVDDVWIPIRETTDTFLREVTDADNDAVIKSILKEDWVEQILDGEGD